MMKKKQTNTKKIKKYLKEKDHIFLGIVPPSISIPLGLKLKFLFPFFRIFDHDLDKNLKDIRFKYTGDEYIGACLVSHSLLGFLSFFLMFSLIKGAEDITPEKVLTISFLIGFVFFFLLIYLAIKMPLNLKMKDVKDMEKNLIYVLKDMVLHAKSGGTLYEAVVNSGNSDTGRLSEEFDIAAREVNMGFSLMSALERLASRVNSEYVKKTCWRLVDSIKTGSNLETTLQPIINELSTYQKSRIENYVKELNLWSLVYMMFSVAIPTIGSTMMVVLSTFSSGGVTPISFTLFGIGCVFIQLVLALFVKSRRPNVQF